MRDTIFKRLLLSLLLFPGVVGAEGSPISEKIDFEYAEPETESIPQDEGNFVPQQRPDDLSCHGVAPGPASNPAADCIRDPQCHRTFAVAHRAGGAHMPENSRSAVRESIRAGRQAIEIDIRFSKDGELFVIHDSKLDRTTSFRGRIWEFTADQLGKALLRNGETLPRFYEIYDLSKGKAILDLHLKDNAVEEIARWIGRCGSFNDVIFFVSTPQEVEAAARMLKEYPAMIVMADVRTWRDVEHAKESLGRWPDIAHVAHTHRLTKDVVVQSHAHGIKVFANSFYDERLGIIGPGFIGRMRIRKLLRWHVDFLQGDHSDMLTKEIEKTK